MQSCGDPSDRWFVEVSQCSKSPWVKFTCMISCAMARKRRQLEVSSVCLVAQQPWCFNSIVELLSKGQIHVLQKKPYGELRMFVPNTGKTL